MPLLRKVAPRPGTLPKRQLGPRAGVRASVTVCALGYEGRHDPQGCSPSRLGNSRHQAPATLSHRNPKVSPTRQARRHALTPPRKSALRDANRGPGRAVTSTRKLHQRSPKGSNRVSRSGTRSSHPAGLRDRTRPGGAIWLLSAPAAPTKLPPSPAPFRMANPGRARAPPPLGLGPPPRARGSLPALGVSENVVRINNCNGAGGQAFKLPLTGHQKESHFSGFSLPP
ncbi:uncharacterized protein [Oryctolagus cuniculus]|uniref:uncharacterized protein n=1 Tax=Oryctolagus cuniculus TaxID=9986 RepID=UPI003879F2D6